MARKRRAGKIAKNVAKQPKVKKMMAEFLADIQYKKVPEAEIKKMLIMGHRGYLAMDEKALSKLFDQMYDHVCSEYEKAVEGSKGTSGYGARIAEERIEQAKLLVDLGDEIYDELFEEVFL